MKSEVPVIRSPEEAEPFFREIAGKLQEHFAVLLLDVRNQPIGKAIVVSIGTADAAICHPRDVFRDAIVKNAVSLICAHNHPSGDTSPSTNDAEASRRLKQAGDILGIPVRDSLIVSEGSPLYSFVREAGW